MLKPPAKRKLKGAEKRQLLIHPTLLRKSKALVDPARVTRYIQRHKPISSVQIFSSSQKKLISMMLFKWLSVWWSCGSLCKSGPSTVLAQPHESQVIPLRYKNKLKVKEHFLFLSLQNGWRPGCQGHGLSSVWENLPQVRKDKSWCFHPAGLAASILQVSPLTESFSTSSPSDSNIWAW